MNDKIYYHITLETDKQFNTGFITLTPKKSELIKECAVNVISSPYQASLPLIDNKLGNHVDIFIDGSKMITKDIDFSTTNSIGIIVSCNKFDFDDIKIFSFFSSEQDSLQILKFRGIIDGPGHEGVEICNNGIDDDHDGKIDCEDKDCLPPVIDEIIKINPSCLICQDGKIIVLTNKIGMISINGGITWVYTNGYIIFDNLNPGVFNIIVKNIKGSDHCGSNTEEVILKAPVGEKEYCDNGSFEYGDFTNWQGLLGEFTNNTVQLNPGFDLNDRHTIIPDNPNQSDPNVGNNIPFSSPTGGVYFMRLGNLKADRTLNAQGVRYEFLVDNINKDFSFWYAIVAEAFHSSVNKNPRFKFKLSDANGNDIYDSGVKKASLDDRFFIHYEGKTIYKGWTCFYQDLSDYLGQTVTFEFYVTDCSERGHFGYAYLDGLCSHTQMKISCDAPAVFCQNQSPAIQVKGTGYNEYKWTISKLKNGQLYDTKEIEKIGYNASNNNILTEYFNQGVNFECVEYHFKLEVYSDCGGYAECSFTSSASCSAYDIDYCDYLFVCTEDPIIKIPGDFDCEGCTYQWTPSYYFGGTSDQQNPTINSNNYTDARNRSYQVTITTSEQCVYNKQVNLIHFPTAIKNSSLSVDYCTFEGNYMLKFPFSLPDDLITVKYYSGDNSVVGVSELDYEKSNAKEKHFTFTHDRLVKNMNYFIDYDINPNIPGSCILGDCGKYRTLLGEVKESNWHYPWRMVVPTVFSPDGNGINDTFYPLPWSPTDMPECKSENGFSSSIYYAKLSIFYRWGGVIMEKEVIYDPEDDSGFNGEELFWDGTFRTPDLSYFLMSRFCKKASSPSLDISFLSCLAFQLFYLWHHYLSVWARYKV